MNGLIDWCTTRARMVMAMMVILIAAGLVSYVSLPKEGEPDIDIPIFYISTPAPGISASDAERLLVKPLEAELRGLDDLKQMTAYGTEGHAGIVLEFNFGWDKQAVLADVRDRVDQARVEFPDSAEESVVHEINLSEFPILIVSLSGAVPERTLLKLAKDLQREVEANPAVLEADIAGERDEILEVLIDPLKMESYNVTASELLTVIDRNNQLVAAGNVESATASFSVTVPGSFETAADVFNLPVKVNGDRVIRLSDVAQLRRTFEDPESLARYNGKPAISLRVSKRLGENIIETVNEVRSIVDKEVAKWPEQLRRAVIVDFSMDESVQVKSMVSQLEGAVATAVLLVMMVVLAALGFRSAILVGVAIPSSFLLAFALMSVAGLPINNMVMFGLILAVGMLVDGAIVVVEYADKEISRGKGPMRAYAAAAKRMFWPIVASTGTTLCAFLPMLFWPGMPGEFMGLLPVTLIFVLTASLLVALVFLPVLGGLAGRLRRLSIQQRALGLTVVALATIAIANSFSGGGENATPFVLSAMVIALAATLCFAPEQEAKPNSVYKRTPFGRLIGLIVLNPAGPFLAIGAAITALVIIFGLYGQYAKGTEFFVNTEPQRAIVFVKARGNLSIAQTDKLVRQVEDRILKIPDIASAFTSAGASGLGDLVGVDSPPDTIGEIMVELQPWGQRRPGADVLQEMEEVTSDIPGIGTEVFKQADGPQQGKPIQLELRSSNWADLRAAVEIARARIEEEPGTTNVDDTRPLPGIDWQITVDRATAGRFGADVATVGPLIQLVTRGAILGTYRPDDSDEELEIRMRFPEADRRLATLDQLKVPTVQGPIPLSNFVTRKAAPRLAEITRRDGERFFLVRADVSRDAPEGVTDVSILEELETWIADQRTFPSSVAARFTGDREEQAKSAAFLQIAFGGALGLMFIIMLAQFNSIYNSVLVLTAVIMSVAGVLIGMLVMGQKFSIIMTGTGIVALAGIVVNNNIVLIDTFQDLRSRMKPLEAIIRTAEARIRPVLLTTITTMAGLTPMMLATSLDFGSGTMSQGAPTALWWVQLATAVVFGLGLATILTLVVTPAALAARVWVARGTGWVARLAAGSEARADARARRKFGKGEMPELIFDDPPAVKLIRAAE
ncbi:MAG: efflux RND transporter permease subunit [Pseudomonadota bacterium]